MIPIWWGLALMGFAGVFSVGFMLWPKSNVPRQVDGYALLGVTAVFVAGLLLTLCGIAQAVS